MSWILGYVGHDIASAEKSISRLTLRPIVQVRRPSLLIDAGGISETLTVSPQSPSGESGWIVSGTAIVPEEASCRFLSRNEWDTLLAAPVPDLSPLDGHFIAVRWTRDNLEAFNDTLGLRTLYAIRVPHGVFFSTRMDWLSKVRGGSELNLAVFGARWLFFNQLDYRPPLNDMERLATGGHARMTPDRIEIRNTFWTPEIGEEGVEEYRSGLMKFSHPAAADSRGISFGLSGGWDSRLLLAHMLDLRSRLTIHTFGDAHHPDVRIASAIAASEQLPCTVYDEPLPDAAALIGAVREFAAAAGVCERISAIQRLRYYPHIYSRGTLVMDGAFGEFGRRKYLNRLLYLGRRALLAQDAEGMSRYFRVPRARIFKTEASAAMERGAIEQIREALSAMPPLGTIGPENFADLLIIRTRLPNWSEPEQSRIDALVQNYMPYAQPSILRAVFRIPVHLKRNGRLHRSMIEERRPSFTRHPLAKGSSTYPFRFRTLPAALLTKLKSAAGIAYRDTSTDIVLGQLKEFVLDTAHSSSVRNFTVYDVPALLAIADGYYAGKRDLAPALDWWLSFELWRQAAI